MNVTAEELRCGVLDCVRNHAVRGAPGRYLYSVACTRPTLYSSMYAARILALFNAIFALGDPDDLIWLSNAVQGAY